MPMLRLIKRSIESIPLTSSGQVLYRDDELTGFGLRVGRKSKTFFAEGQIRRRTVRVSIGRYPLTTPEQARKLAFQRLAAMSQGQHEEKPEEEPDTPISVAAAFEQFFEAKQNLSPRTTENYRRTQKVYLQTWSDQPLQAISRQMVLTMHRQIAQRHGPVAANHVFRHLRSIYNFTAATREGFPPNPVSILSQARAWSPERRRRTLIAPHQLPAWWRAVMQETDDARDFLILALFTGMRRREVTTLRWTNLDLVGRQLHLPVTKNGQPLILPLSGYLAGLLGARRGIAGASEWVFPGPGRSGHMSDGKSYVRRITEKSGVPFMLHDLRRTFITIAESLDIPAYALKRLLNHATDSDVTGGYIVMDAERLRGPTERIACRILELGNGTKIETGDLRIS